MRINVLGIPALVMFLAGPASAHHSFAMFDYSKETTITGEVKELQWINPHIHLIVNVPGADGAVAEWDVEGATPANLRRTGWSRTVVKAGDKISVVIHPLKNGTTGGMLVKAVRGDGTPIGTNG
jgi:hypothetical protein